MSVTAWLNPAAFASVDRDAKNAWSNPERIAASDNSRTICGPGAHTYSDWLRATQFNVAAAVPAGAVILGIEVQIERSASAAASINDSAVFLRKTAGQAGDDKANAANWPLTASEAYQGYGGGTDLWGATWTRAEVISDDFGVDLSAANLTGFARTAYVDHIQVRIYYSIPVQELIGDCAALAGQEGSPQTDYHLKGDLGVGAALAGNIGNIFNLLGNICPLPAGAGLLNLDSILLGNLAAPFSPEVGKLQKFLGPISGLHITTDALPYLGGGVKLTYDAGAPFAVTYWEIIGIEGITGEVSGAHGVAGAWEVEPMGRLKWTIVRANADGLAVNYYFAPTDPSCVGKKDRITVMGRLADYGEVG